ncbi:MAG: peptidase M16 [Magnetovibrio sp.]|nr:peptidase M16 [Magnetovibrio sp.]|tara:strand:+ start:18181 stop:19512 length:1332 start_codon:yes stop_codon:yes gene_type:complete
MSRLLPRAALALAAVVFVLYAAPAKATQIERVVSPGGIEAWLVEDHLNPIISLHLAFRGGSALDPEGKEGLANMVSTLLDEGAGDLDSKAFQQTLEDKSITLRFSAARDSFGARVQVLTEYRDLAFDLLRQAMTEPRFDAEPVSRLRAQLLANLRHESEDADAIAGKTLMKTLYPDHPYGRPTGGTLESVAAIQVADMRAFVKERLARDTLSIGVVGDITAKELAPLLDKTFGALPAKAAPWKVQEVAPKVSGRTIVIEKPLKQSNILFADRGLMRKDPDFYTAYVMNHILGGGGFTSRLYTEVREKRGLAYSVYTYLHPMDRSAIYAGGAGTANARVAETLKVVRDEWAKLAKDGVTEAELTAAKQYLTGSFPLRFTATERIAAMLVGMQTEDLGIDYLDKRNSYIEAVTLDDIRRVARKLLHPDDLTIVVVGEPKDVKPTP